MEHAKPSVQFELGERMLALLFNFRALRAIKEKTGIDFLSQQARELFNVDNLPVFVWAGTQNTGNGLKEEWPTLDWIVDTLTLHDMPRITEVIRSAVPKDETEPGNGSPEESPRHLNGSTSGPSEPLTLVATLRSSGN
jgi:hypothetical protein